MELVSGIKCCAIRSVRAAGIALSRKPIRWPRRRSRRCSYCIGPATNPKSFWEPGTERLKSGVRNRSTRRRKRPLRREAPDGRAGTHQGHPSPCPICNSSVPLAHFIHPNWLVFGNSESTPLPRFNCGGRILKKSARRHPEDNIMRWDVVDRFPGNVPIQGRNGRQTNKCMKIKNENCNWDELELVARRPQVGLGAEPHWKGKLTHEA
jgi:hypothetical protein